MDLKHNTLTTIVFKSKQEFKEQQPVSDFLSEVAKTSITLYGAENIAAYHGVRALLASEGLNPKTHKGVLN